MWYGLMIFLSLTGSLLNLFLGITILFSRNLRSGCGALIANLHFIIFLQCSFGIPSVFIPTYEASVTGPVSNLFCRMSFFPFFVLLPVADWSDMMIGINRFVAICFPFSYSKWTTKPVLISMMTISWIPGIALGFCCVFNFGASFRMILPWGSCGVVPSTRIMSHIISILGVSFPVVVLGTNTKAYYDILVIMFPHVVVER